VHEAAGQIGAVP
jgi:hypothetical protein